MVKHILILFLFFSLALRNLSAQGAEFCSSYKQQLFSETIDEIQYTGDENIDVKYYKLDLTVNYDTTSENIVSIKGTVTILLQILSTADSIFLDLNDNMLVTTVAVNNNTSEFSHSNDKISIPSASYNTGANVKIDITYEGTPFSSGFGSFEYVTQLSAIWTLSEPYGAKDWWPCKNTPADKADSADVWITTKDDLIPTSNGTLVSIIKNNDNTHTYKWHEKYPIAHYLISLAIAPYEKYTIYYSYSDQDSMEVTNYNYPQFYTEARRNAIDETVKMLEIYSELFGEYPFVDEKYGHAEISWGGGMEHQTLTSLGTAAFTSRVISHELAHQWFGDMITCANWNNIWLNEGFATYSEALYLEKSEGYESYLSTITNDMKIARNGTGSVYVNDISDETKIFNSALSYYKAAIVLHMLRGVVGDSTFFNIIYSYANDPELKYGTAATEDFQRVAETISNMDLDWFFQQWIYGDGYPVYYYEWNSQASANPYYLLDLTIAQTQVADGKSETFFKMPIQFEITYDDNTKDTLVVWDSTETQNFSFSLDKNPTNLAIDPKNWILMDTTDINTGLHDGDVVSDNFQLIGIYPNPFNPTTKIDFKIGKSASVNITVYNLLGEMVENIVRNKHFTEGQYTLEWNAENLPSGVYFIRLDTEHFSSTKKAVLLK